MSINTARSLSPLEAKVILSLEWEGTPVVSRAEIIELLEGSKGRADKVIRSLKQKNWLQQLSRGDYLLIPAERGPFGIPDSNMLAIGSHLVEPYYYGYATAAEYYHFTAQSRSVAWIVTTRQVPERTIRNTTFRFVRVVPRKFFAYQPTEVYKQKVIMSDREKTVLDCVDQPECSGGIGEVTRIISVASRELDWKQFVKYTLRFDSVTLRNASVTSRTERKLEYQIKCAVACAR